MSDEIDPETRERIISLICADEDIVRLVTNGPVSGPPPGEDQPYDPVKNYADPNITKADELAMAIASRFFDPRKNMFEYMGIFLEARDRISPRPCKKN